MASGPSRYYLTTPIYYVTADPHLGHAYTTIVGDVLCRYERIRRGRENVFYLTGTDEHGEKLERAAAEQGKRTQELVDEVAQSYRKMWEVLQIDYNDFIRTTEPRHQRVVSWLWRTMRERGDIYEDTYEGLYCVACESFYLEKDLLPGGLCPDHKRDVEMKKEHGFFFRLSRYERPLLDHYAAHPGFIEPAMRMNEVRAFVERGLKDLSVSRSSFSWGIPVPDAPGHVVYVWIDALTNYYSALMEPPERRAFWGTHEQPLAIHLVGKEITRFHAVYWPAMLMSAGLPLPKKIFAHGWWTVDGEKMSKTLGNVVDPRVLVSDIGASALRYFVLREVPLGADGDFSYDALIMRYNSELCNDLGNLLNRTLAMVERFSGGVVRRWPDEEEPNAKEHSLRGKAEEVRRQVEEAMEALQPARALEALFSLVREANTYLEQQAPFTLVKSDPARACHVLYDVLETLRWLSLMLDPFIPDRAVEMRRQLGLADAERTSWPRRFGELPHGTKVKKGATLFPRIEPDRRQALLDKWRAGRRAAAGASAPVGDAPLAAAAPEGIPPLRTEQVSFEDFQRLDMRAARVLLAERVPRKDRLLKVTLDLGIAQRTVVAGLSELIAPEDLVGRTVLFLANLAPRKIGGVLSEGMILAAGGERVVALATADRDVAPGTKVR